MKIIREKLVDFAYSKNNQDLIKSIEKLVYRPVSEVYIPIPESNHFHAERPDFFGKNIGTFKPEQRSSLFSKENRTFKLKFYHLEILLMPILTKNLGKQSSL